MRIWNLYLKGYIGIFNGMGVTEIEIDFSKCKNNIVVIKGDNGSGKSTIFKSLNPFPDPSSSFIPGENAIKRISYLLENNTVLEITYTYKFNPSGIRKTTCKINSISPDGTSIDLNPNSNVNEGKEIICDMLDIDAGFLTLAQLSSDDRGLADKAPSERKKFINDKISELDAFNDIYKKINKKYSELNSMVKRISDKLNSIGNIDSVKNDILSLTNKMGILEDTKVKLISDISALQVESDLCAKDSQEFKRLKEEIDYISSEMQYLGEIKEVTNSQIAEEMSNSASIKKELDMIKDSIDSKNKELGVIATNIDEKEISIQSINLDNLEEIESRISKIKENIDTMDKIFNSLGFTKYKDMTYDEYNFVIESIEDLQELGEKIYNSLDSMEELEFARNVVLGEETDVSSKLQNIVEEISIADNFLKEQERLKEYRDCKEKLLNSFSCNIYKSCPLYGYIESKMGEYSDITNEQIEKCKYKLDDLLIKKKEYVYKSSLYNKTKRTVEMIKEYIHKYNSSIKMIRRFPIPELRDETIESITLDVITGKSINIDLTPFRESKNLFNEVSSHKNDIAELEKLKASMMPTVHLKEQLEKELSHLKEMYDVKNNEIQDLISKEKILNSKLVEINEYTIKLNEELSKYEKYCSLHKEKERKEEELVKYNESWKKSVSIESEIQSKKDRLSQIVSTEIADIQNQINTANAKLTMYNEYIEEYALCNKEFNKIGVIRKYCSPTTGIQTIFMEMYMNKVIGITNQLLSMLFNGEYVLQPFVINEKEFRMPVLGSGLLNDDISSMSTSQICMISMILSFALLRQSSSIYNIIKIDELEGGLDNHNRLAFFDVLNNLMMTLQCEQCIMISHNSELNMKTMDVIILKNSDPSSPYYEGNVIFDFNA